MRKTLSIFLSLMLAFALILGVIPASFSATQKIEPGGQYNLSDYQKIANKSIGKFNESPQLLELVKQKKLPSVEDRLPKNPAVVQPFDKLGRYGGTWRVYSPIAWYGSHHIISYEPLVRIASNLTDIEPNIAERWKLSRDAKTLTLYLRKGIRWSDGTPFTADDIMFWYEDITLNKELTPNVPTWLITGGDVAKIKKIDDYTIEMNFSQPYPLILYELSASKYPYAPKHYLKQFHPKYTSKEKLDAMAKEAGLQFWYQLFMKKNDTTINADLPVLWAWRTTMPWGPAEGMKVERNPYYWKVDPEGNQLPYIDAIRTYYVSDWNMAFLKLMSGEGEMQGVGFKLMDYTLYMENREKGGYHVVRWEGLYPGEPTMMFNQTAKDPALRKIFRDVRFRQAMSLAINRVEINEILYFGLCEPLQPTITDKSPFYDESFAKAYAEYNPKKAEELLDKIGLKRGPDGWRMRPDGKRLELTIETRQPLQWIDVADMVSKYWNAVGVKTAVKVEENTLWAARVGANEHEVVTQGFSTNPLLIGGSAFNMTSWTAWAGEWARWYQSGGKAGEKPDGDALKVIDLWEKYKISLDPKHRIRLGKEIMRLHAKNLWIIGAGGRKLPYIFLVKNNFRNWPEDFVQDLSFGGGHGRAHPEQCFIEQ